MTKEAGEMNDLLQDRRKNLTSLKEEGVTPYSTDFDKVYSTEEVKTNYDRLREDSTMVKTAGRIMAVRNHGKSTFVDLKDVSGEVNFM